MTAVPVPAPGQLVTVRQRQYVITDLGVSTLPADSSIDTVGSQHLVKLSSVEDDGLGEEAEVIWELEPGVRTADRVALPTPEGFDAPHRLDSFLDAVRWGAVSSADMKALQSPFRSGIAIEDYQLEPVVRALQMPRVNLLIADDVGLGKTIEAGLVAQELLLRHRARTIVIVCPSSLQVQWRDEMRDKFGLEFRIVDTALMRELRRTRGLHVNPWTHFPRLITSIDFLKRERPLRSFREALPGQGEAAFPRKFDLLIVDEAHNVAPSGGGSYATDSLRTQAIRTLAPHFEHKLFLTATPHNGYKESFTALLELLDNQRFARTLEPDRDQVSAVMVRRMKSEMKDWRGAAKFAHRRIEALEVDYTEEEKRAHQALRRYAELRQKGVTTNIEKFATDFVMKTLKKRLFSSPAAFATTLAKHVKSVQAGSPSATMPVSYATLRRQVDDIDEEFADDEDFEEATSDVVETTTRLFRALTDEEADLLSELIRYAENASGRPDSKAAALIRWLSNTLRPNGKWNDERVILFTEYRTTQKWLHGLLAAAGLAGDARLLTMYGGMRTEDREHVKNAFQAGPEVSDVRILLATDAASEGVNLQNHCSKLVHYEIPWNPNRMEQRNGRVDRHGQKAPEVLVYHFVGQKYSQRGDFSTVLPGQLEGDLEFLLRAVRKVENIREDLGKVGLVIAAQVEEAMLGRRQHLDTADAEREAEPVRRMLKFERKLREQVDKLTEQLHESRRTLRMSPENIRAVVETGLELAGQPPLREARVQGLWPSSSHRACPVFHMPALRGTWSVCRHGLAHPHTGVERPIVFDHGLADGRDDVVLVHLNHRLVQNCLRLLRAEIWSQGPRRKLFRVTARTVPSHVLDTPAVIAHGRLVVLGGDNHRLHEEVIAAGGRIREGRFSRLNVGEVKEALDSASVNRPDEDVERDLAALWPSLSGPLFQALEVRTREKLGDLEKFASERAHREAQDLASVLHELERMIRAELAETHDDQLRLELWTEAEKEQLQRNRESLRARLERIPKEIEQETAAIHSRYANPTPRLFPVCVTFLVPARLSGGMR